jgi:hypothetical protein
VPCCEPHTPSELRRWWLSWGQTLSIRARRGGKGGSVHFLRGSQINDEGLKALCEHLPNLESISLAHAKFTDAGAVHLAKLTKLKGLELGTKTHPPPR